MTSRSTLRSSTKTWYRREQWGSNAFLQSSRLLTFSQILYPKEKFLHFRDKLEKFLHFRYKIDKFVHFKNKLEKFVHFRYKLEKFVHFRDKLDNFVYIMNKMEWLRMFSLLEGVLMVLHQGVYIIPSSEYRQVKLLTRAQKNVARENGPESIKTWNDP